jgi:hypothetical protein
MGTLAATTLSTGQYLSLLAILLLCVVLYMVYKIIWHPDFGLPVRRRLFCRRLSVERHQVAFVPLWWSNLQVQRALEKHWKDAMRQSFPSGRRGP